jgi:mannosyl-3-phosphoglycerate synthase
MVRILWRYKPKISAGLYFRKWGRISEITNKYLNGLISTKTGFETEVVTTANAGEHALSMQLAEILPFASGYAVESQELISIFESFGGILPTKESKAIEQGIDILQIETRNPHLHEERGNQHLNEILLSSLSTIYHSPLCDKEVKQAIMAELTSQGILKDGETPSPVHINAPLNKVKVNKFVNAMRTDIDKYRVSH